MYLLVTNIILKLKLNQQVRLEIT